ncbi:MAG TPA: hypothetical protein VK050_08675 [Flavobacteriaceae bacterium]|nr:hypothetical protein [Flavobacteriaceae bacterium]
MSKKEEVLIEKLAPQMLLKRGVKVNVRAPLFLRIFGKKELALTMYQPTARTLLKIANVYLKLTTIEDDGKLTSLLKHYTKHSKKVHRVVSLGFLNSPRKMWRTNILAWYLARTLTEQHFLYLFQLLILHGGVEDFLSTIRLIEQTRITKPMNLSQERKTS